RDLGQQFQLERCELKYGLRPLIRALVEDIHGSLDDASKSRSLRHVLLDPIPPGHPAGNVETRLGLHEHVGSCNQLSRAQADGGERLGRRSRISLAAEKRIDHLRELKFEKLDAAGIAASLADGLPAVRPVDVLEIVYQEAFAFEIFERADAGVGSY